MLPGDVLHQSRHAHPVPAEHAVDAVEGIACVPAVPAFRQAGVQASEFPYSACCLKNPVMLHPYSGCLRSFSYLFELNV